MTLFDITNTILTAAKNQPNVNAAGEGDIFTTMNSTPQMQYSCVFLTQGTHSTSEAFDFYNFTIFYIDRLNSDMERDRLQIQSVGKEVLGNVIRDVCDKIEMDEPMVQYNPFTQRFIDETAGVYCTVTFTVERDYLCDTDYNVE